MKAAASLVRGRLSLLHSNGDAAENVICWVGKAWLASDGPLAQVIEDLISAGADLERADTTGHTALHYAAGYGRCTENAMAKC